MSPGSLRALALGLALCPASFCLGSEVPDFNREIRPILSENCFYCHGQDPQHRKAGRRLDIASEAAREIDGIRAIAPGDPGQSELLIRVLSQDPDEIMPPPDSHRKLAPREIDLLRRWIAGGAPYAEHWAFTPPVKLPLPSTRKAEWMRQPLDAFILARLEKEGLEPSPPAPPEIWLRRASFDLTGLAPTPEEASHFAADAVQRGEAAYADAAERLLASPRFGERLAQEWLDAARYADTSGFNNDSARTMWRWRDWVIEAFNRNLPYDRFLTEQLAGDLLPSPTLDQRIATGFCRNHVINSEGGIIDEEYRVEYVADRVRTLGMAVMGLTLECARCHDHKFDPISQRDYYQLFAFFNQAPEFGEDARIANAPPLLVSPTPEQQEKLAALDAAIAAGAAKLDALRAAHERSASAGERLAIARLMPGAAACAGEKPALALDAKAGPEGKALLIDALNPEAKPLAEVPAASISNLPFAATLSLDGTRPAPLQHWKLDAGKAWSFTAWLRWDGSEGALFSSMDYSPPPSSAEHGRGAAVRIASDGRIEVRLAHRWPAYATHLFSTQKLAAGQWHHLAITREETLDASGIRVFIDGDESGRELLTDGLTQAPGTRAITLGGEGGPAARAFRGSIASAAFHSTPLAPEAVQSFLETTLHRALAESDALADSHLALWTALHLRRFDPEFARLWKQRLDLLEQRRALEKDLPTTMVMADLATPRPTHILDRGLYDSPRAPVAPGVPESIRSPWPADAPRDRLGLAQWLTQPTHPLTARVAVNRFWQQLFGIGLVKTAEDFGYQSEYPSHPELLDFLAHEFGANGWDVKALLRGIVLSAAYRQSSAATPGLLDRDPENRLLARGPRFRLSAEAIRDHALAVSGLLEHRLGGPSVYPWQPEHLYREIVTEGKYPGTTWPTSTGPDLWRRSLYTFWKRTVLHPAMSTFDAPDREFCSVQRLRTNTPLQALLMMNEPAMLEAARHFGNRIHSAPAASTRDRLALAFRTATGRSPRAAELELLDAALARFRSDFKTAPATAKSWTLDRSPSPEAAAWSALASLLLNLDETLTRH
jgi:hypothetical protein